VGLGIERDAPPGYYLIAVAALLALYALPVAAGALAALVLMRVAPAGRAKEVATGASVALAAALVLGMRALRPERLSNLTPEQFDQALARFAAWHVGWLPSAWGSSAVWRALRGEVSPAALLLAVVSVALLAGVARVAALAYRAGWFRALDAAGKPGVVGALPAARWEAPLARLGPAGGMIVKDLRLLARDPSQWSQLLVLAALAGVYFISTASLAAQMQTFRDLVGALNLMFLGFLMAGVGIRTAFPLVSLEGEGFWLLRTAPLRARQVVLAKFWGALPVMVVLGGGLGVAVAGRLGVSPVLALASPIAGVCAGIAATGLGVGLGAAFPRFDATSPAEVPLSTGGLLYMALALVYAVLATLLFAYPAYRTLRAPGSFHWSSAEGLAVLAAVAVLTLVWTVLPLLLGSARLARYESGVG
jgi:ABC-2 type transport system permease protein